MADKATGFVALFAIPRATTPYATLSDLSLSPSRPPAFARHPLYHPLPYLANSPLSPPHPSNATVPNSCFIPSKVASVYFVIL